MVSRRFYIVECWGREPRGTGNGWILLREDRRRSLHSARRRAQQWADKRPAFSTRALPGSRGNFACIVRHGRDLETIDSEVMLESVGERGVW